MDAELRLQDFALEDYQEMIAGSFRDFFEKECPSSLVREVLLNGTPDEVIDQAAEWRDCGVRYMVLINLSFFQRSLRKGLAAVMPFNNLVRGLKKL